MSAEGKPAWRLLRLPLVVTLLGFATAVLFVGGSYFYLQQEKKDDVASKRRLQDANLRLSNANKDADDLRDSVDAYQQLVSNGIFEPENRLDWIEAVGALKAKHHLTLLEYHLDPQRPVALPGGRSFSSLEVFATRVQFRMRAYHDGDLLAFLDDVAHSGHGFFPMDRCAMRLIEPTAEALSPRMEAECNIEWITLKDRRAGGGANGAK